MARPSGGRHSCASCCVPASMSRSDCRVIWTIWSDAVLPQYRLCNAKGPACQGVLPSCQLLALMFPPEQWFVGHVKGQDSTYAQVKQDVLVE